MLIVFLASFAVNVTTPGGNGGGNEPPILKVSLNQSTILHHHLNARPKGGGGIWPEFFIVS